MPTKTFGLGKKMADQRTWTSVSGSTVDCAGNDCVLIGVVRRPGDLRAILNQRWYRVPVRQKFSRNPRFLAFYLTKSCGPQGEAITHYAPVKKISRSLRRRLLPEEGDHPRAGEPYWKFHLGEVSELPHRIENKLRRRLTFAYTTMKLLLAAREIGELFHIPPLEEVMRKLLKESYISFKPQVCVMHKKRCRYRLDFAIFCRRGKLALECDHSRWHRRPARKIKDKRRDRWLQKRGWMVMRFSEETLMCRPKEALKSIQARIMRLGGATEPEKPELK